MPEAVRNDESAGADLIPFRAGIFSFPGVLALLKKTDACLLRYRYVCSPWLMANVNRVEAKPTMLM